MVLTQVADSGHATFDTGGSFLTHPDMAKGSTRCCNEGKQGSADGSPGAGVSGH
jgi:hypothetical protein